MVSIISAIVAGGVGGFAAFAILKLSNKNQTISNDELRQLIEEQRIEIDELKAEIKTLQDSSRELIEANNELQIQLKRIKSKL